MHTVSHHTPPRPMDSLTEAQLVSRAAHGDGAAFEAIMRRHNRLLFRAARSIVGNDAEAEDVVQEAWMRAWRALAKYRAESKLSTWLARIAVNEALGRLRRKKADVIPLEAAMMSSEPETQAALSDDPKRGPEPTVQRLQMRELIEAQIDLLPEAFRSVFMLRAIEEMRVEEVAEALGIPETTVRTRYFRARSLLREGLAQHMDSAFSDAFRFDGARCDRMTAAVLARGEAEGLSGPESAGR